MDIALVLNYLRPNEEWSINDNDYEQLIWFDETSKPTLEQIKKAQKAAEADFAAKLLTKENARASALAKLAELGLTADEIAAL
jgi:hypothetical protein